MKERKGSNGLDKRFAPASEDEGRDCDRWSLAIAQKVAHAGSFDWDLKNDVLTTCNGLDELYGLGPGQEMKSIRDWLAYVIPEDREAAQQALESAKRTGELNTQWRIMRPDTGEVRWIDARAKVFFDEEGAPVRLIGINQDITERKSAEEDIAALTRRLEAHLGNTPLAVVEFSPEFRITRWSGEAERMFGYSATEAAGKTFEELELIHRKDLPHVKAKVEDMLNRGERRLLLQVRNCHKDDTEVDCEWYISVLRHEDGNLESLLCFGLDVTERKRAERELQRSREGLQRYAAEMAAIFAAQNDAVTVFSPEGVVIRANPAAFELYGFDPIGMRPETMMGKLQIHGGTTSSVTLRALRGEAAQSVEFGTSNAREPRSFLASSAPMRDEKHRIIGAVTVVRDITERKRDEEAVRRNAAELQAILDAVPAAVFIARDPHARNIVANRTAYEFLRVEPGKSVSKSAPPGERPENFRLMRNGVEIPPDDLPVQMALRTAQKIENCELDVVFDNGYTRRLFGNAIPLPDEHGKARGAVAAFIDITERVRAEERLRQAQKLESIGVLAGGIAHDFNNLLTGIMGNASLLLDEMPASAADRVRRIVSGAERAADLTRQLLAYAGKGRFMVRELDLSEVLHGTAGLLRLSIPKHVDLRLELQPGLPHVCADAGQLEQLVMNLAINAAEATEGRPNGRVIVSTHACDIGQQVLDEFGEQIPPARYACIEVADNGIGMDEETRAKIFDPFFTTKFTGRGLGLAAVSGIMRSQKGAITIDTAPGKGTRFRLYLPAMQQPEQTEPQRKNGILVVDDEEEVREFIATAVERAGFVAIPAASGKEALERWEEQQHRIALVVMDVVMPGIGGGELLAAFQHARSDLKVVLTSGYNETEARRLCGKCNVAGFIQKPYSARKLVESVKEALGQT